MKNFRDKSQQRALLEFLAILTSVGFVSYLLFKHIYAAVIWPYMGDWNPIPSTKATIAWAITFYVMIKPSFKSFKKKYGEEYKRSFWCGIPIFIGVNYFFWIEVQVFIFPFVLAYHILILLNSKYNIVLFKNWSSYRKKIFIVGLIIFYLQTQFLVFQPYITKLTYLKHNPTAIILLELPYKKYSLYWAAQMSINTCNKGMLRYVISKKSFRTKTMRMTPNLFKDTLSFNCPGGTEIINKLYPNILNKPEILETSDEEWDEIEKEAEQERFPIQDLIVKKDIEAIKKLVNDPSYSPSHCELRNIYNLMFLGQYKYAREYFPEKLKQKLSGENIKKSAKICWDNEGGPQKIVEEKVEYPIERYIRAKNIQNIKLIVGKENYSPTPCELRNIYELVSTSSYSYALEYFPERVKRQLTSEAIKKIVPLCNPNKEVIDSLLEDNNWQDIGPENNFPRPNDKYKIFNLW